MDNRSNASSLSTMRLSIFALAQLTQPFVWIRAGERAGLQE